MTASNQKRIQFESKSNQIKPNQIEFNEHLIPFRVHVCVLVEKNKRRDKDEGKNENEK